eukprot:2757598-Amphidinium_carterae.1
MGQLANTSVGFDGANTIDTFSSRSGPGSDKKTAATRHFANIRPRFGLVQLSRLKSCNISTALEFWKEHNSKSRINNFTERPVKTI